MALQKVQVELAEQFERQIERENTNGQCNQNNNTS